MHYHRVFKIIIIVSNFLITSTSFSQSLAEDLKAMNKNVLDHFHFEMSYNFYPTHASKEAIDHMAGTYIKYGDNMYNKLGDYVSVLKGKIFVFVDNETKNILYGNDYQSDLSMYQDFPLDSLSKVYKNITYKKEGKNKIYSVYIDDVFFPYDRFDIWLDEETFMIKKLVWYYRDIINYSGDPKTEKPPRVELIYVSYKKITTIPAVMDLAQYVSIKNDKVTPSKKYLNYAVTTQK